VTLLDGDRQRREAVLSVNHQQNMMSTYLNSTQCQPNATPGNQQTRFHKLPIQSGPIAGQLTLSVIELVSGNPGW